MRVPAWMIAVGLAILTVAAYGTLARNDFIDLDDGKYVTENAQVKGGLTPANIAWAWSTFEAGYYQPLTWMSLQLDASLFSGGEREPRLYAAGFHIDNLFWHTATTVLLFFVLRRLTAATGCSAVVAALFAVHPLHVESVAWATERKDVLSTFFWVLTLGAYSRWVETRQPQWYSAVLVSFVLGSLAKPMLVTLPCVLLLLDIWPLKRFGTGRHAFMLIVEKLPLFAWAAGASAITIHAQGSASAIANVSFNDRLANAVAAYGWYLEKTFWPTNLAVFYPHLESRWTWPPVVAGTAALAIGTLAAAALFRRVPALLVGWLWFIGTLVPVIGIVQVGSQAMADRFSYVPHIGLFIGLVWTAAALLDTCRVPAPAQVGTASALVLILAGATFVQVGYWKDSWTIWSHALDATVDNHRAHAHVGRPLMAKGEWTKARDHYEMAAKLEPNVADYQYDLGVSLLFLGENEQAAECFRNALSHKADYYDAWHNLGIARMRLGELDRAAKCFQQIVDARPDAADELAWLGTVFWLQGQRQAAAATYERALTIKSTEPEALNGLGLVRLSQHREEEAAKLFAAALRFNPRSVKTYSNFGVALGRLGRWRDAATNHSQAVELERRTQAIMTQPPLKDLALDERRLAFALTMLGQTSLAATAYAEAVRLDPAWPKSDSKTAWRLATAADPQERDPAAAFELATMACQAVANPPVEYLDTLAAACAACRRFDDAKDAARKALAKAEPEQAGPIKARLALYEREKAFVEKEPSSSKQPKSAASEGTVWYSDQDPNAPVVNELRIWGDLVIQVCENHLDDPAQYKTIDAVRSAWVAKKFIIQTDLPWLKDTWGNALVWHVEKSDSVVKITISSNGINGLYENKGGDDIWIEILLSKGETKTLGSHKTLANLAQQLKAEKKEKRR